MSEGDAGLWKGWDKKAALKIRKYLINQCLSLTGSVLGSCHLTQGTQMESFRRQATEMSDLKEFLWEESVESPFPSSLLCATASIYLLPLPPSHFVLLLLSIILIKHFWGLWWMKDSMWSALDQRCPSSSCFALIVLLALCLGIHLFRLSGCWKVAFSLKFFFQLILVCFIACTLSKEVINNPAVPAEKLRLNFFFLFWQNNEPWSLWSLGVYEAFPRSSSFLQKFDFLFLIKKQTAWKRQVFC